jgi:hypothetical protein
MEGSEKRMNIRRGMFRLWVVASALFVLVAGAASYNGIREEFTLSSIDYDAIAKKYGGDTLFPVDCEQARCLAATDYSSSEGLCWYATGNFRRLYPEYKDINDHDLSEKIYAKAGRSLTHPHPWVKVAEAASIAFGAPLAVLALGYSLSWALAGFRAGPTSRDGKSSATP